MAQQYYNLSLIRKIKPWHLAAAGMVGVVLFTALGRLVGYEGDIGRRFPWIMSVAFSFVFSIFSSILLLAKEEVGKYISQSIGCYMGLILVSGAFAYWITGIPPGEAGAHSVVLAMTIGYTVFLGIMGTIRFLISFFNQEELDKLSGNKRRKGRRRRQE